MIPQPNQWDVVFAHPAFPKSVEPLLTRLHCGNLCLLGRPLISSPPRAPEFASMSHQITFLDRFSTSLHRRIGTFNCNAGAKISDNHQHSGEPTPFSWVQEGSAEALISLDVHGVGDLDCDRLSALTKRHVHGRTAAEESHVAITAPKILCLARSLYLFEPRISS